MRSDKVKLPEQVISAFEMQRKPAAFQRRALQQPLTVTSNGEPTLVVMSVDQYQRLNLAAAGSIAPDQNRPADYPRIMRRTEALSRLKAHHDDLATLGVSHLALFGSVARDSADDMSDVDIVVDTADGRALGLFALSRIREELERILGRPVDVISRRGLDHTKQLKQRIAGDLTDVF